MAYPWPLIWSEGQLRWNLIGHFELDNFLLVSILAHRLILLVSRIYGLELNLNYLGLNISMSLKVDSNGTVGLPMCDFLILISLTVFYDLGSNTYWSNRKTFSWIDGSTSRVWSNSIFHLFFLSFIILHYMCRRKPKADHFIHFWCKGSKFEDNFKTHWIWCFECHSG